MTNTWDAQRCTAVSATWRVAAELRRKRPEVCRHDVPTNCPLGYTPHASVYAKCSSTHLACSTQWSNSLLSILLCQSTRSFISPHDIAMPKGLYFTAVVFSFLLFSMPNLRSHWTDLNQTWTHIHLWLLFEKLGPNSPGHLPYGWGKKRFWRVFDRVTLCYRGTCGYLVSVRSSVRSSVCHKSEFY